MISENEGPFEVIVAAKVIALLFGLSLLLPADSRVAKPFTDVYPPPPIHFFF
jgi:hypothetical protein